MRCTGNAPVKKSANRFLFQRANLPIFIHNGRSYGTPRLKSGPGMRKTISLTYTLQTELNRKHHSCMELTFLDTTHDNSGLI